MTLNKNQLDLNSMILTFLSNISLTLAGIGACFFTT